MKHLVKAVGIGMMLAGMWLQTAEAGSRKKNVVEEPVQPSVVLTNELDTLAYCYGVFFGNQYSNFSEPDVVVPGETMKIDLFLKAFDSAMRRDSAALLIDHEFAQEFLQNFQSKIFERLESQRQAALAETKKQGEAYMAMNAQKESVRVLESGLQVEMLKEGTGKKPTLQNQVRINYKGMLVDGTVFDENKDVTFELGGVIAGFREAIMQLQEGGKVVATMPSDLGYGDRGAGEHIPGGSTLIFEIELLEVL